jgi:hypothetical protein
MTNQVLFIQGGGEGVHDTWDSKSKQSYADSLAATISSITTCQKSPPISGA